MWIDKGPSTYVEKKQAILAYLSFEAMAVKMFWKKTPVAVLSESPLSREVSFRTCLRRRAIFFSGQCLQGARSLAWQIRAIAHAQSLCWLGSAGGLNHWQADVSRSQILSYSSLTVVQIGFTRLIIKANSWSEPYRRPQQRRPPPPPPPPIF